MHRRDLFVQQLCFSLAPLLVLAVAVAVMIEIKYAPLAPVPLEPVSADSVPQLEARFSALNYQWPPEGDVPPLVVDHLPAGFDSLDPARRKSVFFRSLLPVVLAENRYILEQRTLLLRQFDRGDLVPGSRAWTRVQEIAQRYRVEGDLNAVGVRKKLLRRVDKVPSGLVLAQAANESAWGTSRFARQGNNLFGQWTYREEAGLMPRDRPEGASHFVRAFPDVRSSVRAYLHNINIGHAYKRLRRLRARMRREGRDLDPVTLAAGLERYSERRGDYVDEIRAMIVGNGLNRLGQFRLAG
jgi:Bax protein